MVPGLSSYPDSGKAYTSMTRKALTLGSAVIDIIVTIDPERIEQMQMRNADTSFLLVEEGRKVDAESITRHIGGGGVNTAVSLARLGFDTATLVKTGDDRNREDVTTRLTTKASALITCSRTGTSPPAPRC
jgi:ribokinase